ncbi:MULTISPECIES: DNA sulfur modification protein DndB [Bradyrhizobium]|uniref:DNA sulfur modification protein DndB n=1 Tax=Bradyrhizobium TaxID=374 RepID=UPI000D13E54B|nr:MULTISPECIES: DNA sulfur modification protein DndB [Bradyrhizobium]PSO19508.1 hypothetical protein C7G42_14745 [Bradyrhizobium sp. MOS003]QDP22720.1 hypothetical protein FNV92_11370 [Bradyrhizobium cosmicum]
MGTLIKTVLLGKQAGKVVFTGSMPASEHVNLLRAKEMIVNPNAQRSLGKAGPGKETTSDLIDNDKILKTDRAVNFIKFVNRVMDNVDRAVVNEGFFGSVSFVLPASFTKAKFDMKLAEDTVVGTLTAKADMGESFINIADGQGRIVGFHAMERELVLKINRLKEAIKRIEKKAQSAAEEKNELAEAEAALARVRHFLSHNDLPFVLYAHKVETNGTVVGLNEDAEKRCYIEGNALNSQASKEDVIKYEQFSPIIVDLHAFRDDLDWMSADMIEEDSKSIGSTSPKIFTLSALVQAYSWGIVNDNKPLKNLDLQLRETVEKRKGFCHAFWRKVTDLFEPIWTDSVDGELSDRIDYLKKSRQNEKNVLFQAIFLQALGRLCYVMGKQAGWDEESPLLMKLNQLSPSLVDYRAAKKHHFDADGELVVDEWNEEWRNAMMKQSVDKTTGEVKGYSFNNATENISATRHLLSKKIGLSDVEVPDQADLAEAA